MLSELEPARLVEWKSVFLQAPYISTYQLSRPSLKAHLITLAETSLSLSNQTEFVNEVGKHDLSFSINVYCSDRRKLRSSENESYKDLVLEYNATIEKFLLLGQDALLADLGVDKQQFEISVEALNENGEY